jgi:uncharacterized protein DUF3551
MAHLVNKIAVGVAMRFFLFALGIVVGAGAIVTRAEAQNYPWCAYLRGGGTNCGFSTFDQCMATLAGMGGSCMQNTQYQPPAAAARARAAAPSHREKPQPKPQEKLIAPQPQ